MILFSELGIKYNLNIIIINICYGIYKCVYIII